MIRTVEYLPHAQRTVDSQYRHMLGIVLIEGEPSTSAHEEPSMTVLCPGTMKFNLSNGVPLLTERSMKGIWKSSLGEIFAFINGIRTLEGLDKFGVNRSFWGPFATEKKCAKRGLAPGDLGPGSYGAAFHDFPMPNGETFNQFGAIVEQLKELPHIRTNFVSPWIPFYIPRGKGKVQKVVVAPCHGWMYFRVFGEWLDLVMIQRSADMVVGVPSNMIQYAALHMAVARVTGLKPRTYHHNLIDTHIYTDKVEEDELGRISQLDAANEILCRASRKLPCLDFTDDAPTDDIFAFRAHHFVLSEYEHGDPIRGISVAI